MIRGGNHQQAADVEEELARNSRHAAAVATSRQWSAQTESRIVRVSRVFGGKDRHSKVKTVKGLRDRRVRLSVPTAIQLYDLQDRLGLNQPSKVVDWLLNAARHEIDKLPPLQFPPQDLMVGHLTPHNMPLMVHDEKFGHLAAAASLASGGGGGGAKVSQQGGVVDVDGTGAHHLVGRFPGGYHRFMELDSALGMVSGAMALPYNNNYTGEAWNNSGGGVHDSGSPQIVAAAAHHSPFPSLLSLAPRPHQLAFYSSEADQQFQVENIGSQSLSLSSARAYHDQAS